MKYILIALGLLLVGSVADVPVMFFAVHGSISLVFVIIVGFLADIVPDFFWYWLGGKIGVERYERLPFFRQKPERMAALERAIDRHGAIILFCSKFVYLFGIPAQVTAGAHHYPLKKAVIANSLGSLGWLAVLYTLAHVFTSVEIIEDNLKNVQTDFTVFAIVAIGIYFILTRLLEAYIKRD